nr:LuxR family transcriptional regulator [Pseudoruegeria sp. HB172150]
MNKGLDLDTDCFAALSPAGHFLALRIGFAFPIFEQNSLPARWIERYSGLGLVLADPVMHWLYSNTGATRWSAMDIDDPRGVMDQAAEFGLAFGVAVCCADAGPHGQRSFGSFARSDREFTSHEIETLEFNLKAMHDSLVPPTNLTRAELEALGMVKNGLLMKEIADLLGVSEGAVKQRLKNAKSKLNAKTSTHAATMATSYGLI